MMVSDIHRYHIVFFALLLPGDRIGNAGKRARNFLCPPEGLTL